ncbi:calcium-binding protein [Salipiger marinus]|uniref:Hemolysin-type calcium-binding repeat-containing protein n=1 Tax=Salipiger marinus TaxID=555512 RepID=A0A1G8PWJ5_9RHOB|nr:calcium-binding protein [Salipiger marinus]SDI96738.1 Hemolysin-type calcium-binding repeat-containing protein [Salipiger marinus]
MPTPIIVLAGQSNAARLSGEVIRSLDERYWAGQYELVRVYSSGAPLTSTRATKSDWLTSGELRSQLVTATVAALRQHSDGYVAGVIWVQGEADTDSSGIPAQYDDAFFDLLDDFRDGVRRVIGTRAQVDTAPVAISGLSEHAPEAPNRKHWTTIQTTLDAIGAARAGIVTVDPDAVASEQRLRPGAMFSDGLHYSNGFSPMLANALVGGLDAATRELGSGSAFGRVHSLPDAARMIGGQGDDIFYVDDRGDRVVEDAGHGNDTVISSISFALRDHSQHLEVLDLTGTADLWGTGNGAANRITGNDGDNVLNGAWGNDTLIGGNGNDRLWDSKGADRLVGGRGNDVYLYDNDGDQIVEAAGEGMDMVYATRSIELRHHSQHIERLALLGAAAINGTGNGADNMIIGNVGNNMLNGAWGNDTLRGGAGNDTLRDSAGNDVLEGGSGADVFVFGAGFGKDVVTDFDPLQRGEVIDLSGVPTIDDYADLRQNHMTQSGDNVLIRDGAGNHVILLDVWLGQLSADDFVF